MTPNVLTLKLAGTSLVALAATILVLAALVATPANATFDLKEFDVTFTNADGSPATQAGSHPFAMTTSLQLNTTLLRSEPVPDGELKDLTAEQIAGLVGDPAATPRCSTTDFVTIDNSDNKFTSCPDSTAVGLISTHILHGEGGGKV